MGFQLKKLMGTLQRNRAGKRTERFTMLDAPIDDIFHFFRGRACEDAAVSQRPGTIFHTPLEPSQNLSRSKALGRGRDYIGRPVVPYAALLSPDRFDFGIGVFRSG